MGYIKSKIRVLRHTPINSIAKVFFPESFYNRVRDYLIRDSSIRICFGNDLVVVDPKSKNVDGVVFVSYWDGLPNFGDVIGPYLVSKITSKPVLNIYDEKKPGLLTVGSILQSINRKDMVVWGSGLIDIPNKETVRNIVKYNPRILSVRGLETAKCLLGLGINVPDQKYFGDPALVLPLFYKPSVEVKEGIGICPHYKHKPYFVVSDGFRVVDVQKDVESVVRDIASLSVCISTSLHGLIIAQAYGIPWVWLEVIDNNLEGDDFKFKDFISMLDLDNMIMPHVKVELNDIDTLDFEDIAKKAILPNKRYNENKILEAFKVYLKS